MNDLQAIADRVEIEALRGEFHRRGDDARPRPPRVAVHPDGVLRMPNIGRLLTRQPGTCLRRKDDGDQLTP
jgi:hypothetical protein